MRGVKTLIFTYQIISSSLVHNHSYATAFIIGNKENST